MFNQQTLINSTVFSYDDRSSGRNSKIYGEGNVFKYTAGGNQKSSVTKSGKNIWSDKTVLQDRAILDVSSDPARLTVKDIRESDAGVYRCRVDFFRQPTKTTWVTLIVVGKMI